MDTPEKTPTSAALCRGRVDARPLQRLPGRLQQQPLLRVHRQRLTRRDTEEPRVEQPRTPQEPTLARCRTCPRGPGPGRTGPPGPSPGRRGRTTFPHGPRRTIRHRSSGSATPPGSRQDIPTIAIGSSGSAATVTGVGGRAVHRVTELLTQVPGEGQRGGVVEDQRGGQLHPGRRAQPVPQLDRGQRVEPDVAEPACALRQLRGR